MRELHLGLERGNVTEGDRNRERERVRDWRGKMDTHTWGQVSVDIFGNDPR